MVKCWDNKVRIYYDSPLPPKYTTDRWNVKQKKNSTTYNTPTVVLNLHRGGRIILKLILLEKGVTVWTGSHLIQDGEAVAGYCEHGKEHIDSIKYVCSPWEIYLYSYRCTGTCGPLCIDHSALYQNGPISQSRKQTCSDIREWMEHISFLDDFISVHKKDRIKDVNTNYEHKSWVRAV